MPSFYTEFYGEPRHLFIVFAKDLALLKNPKFDVERRIQKPIAVMRAFNSALNATVNGKLLLHHRNEILASAARKFCVVIMGDLTQQADEEEQEARRKSRPSVQQIKKNTGGHVTARTPIAL
jgi:hypothetical protein